MTDLRQHIADDLARARRRSEALTTEVLEPAELTAQHSPIMSPLVWDLAHIGNQEELWLVRDAGRREAVRSDIDDLYDAFKHPRRDRPALPLLDPAESLAYTREVRAKALDVLAEVPLEGRRLTGDGFVFGMVVQHEQQHVETMLATHQLRSGAAVLDAPPAPAPAVDPARLPRDVYVPGGPFTMGTSVEPWALDNERPAHRVDVPAFRIDTFPVSNAEFAAFVDDGGYADPRWWTAAGWDHVRAAG
jgi:iron(II)-dependent oxidoreductase